MIDTSRRQIFQTAIGFSITTRCPIKCAHCIINAGPQRKETMPVYQAINWLHQCARYKSGKIKAIIITGGEPFLCSVLLKTMLETNASLGLVSIVVTNAFWARSVDSAEKTLEQFPQIDLLSISTDRYHREFIPIERVRNALQAANKRNIPFNVSVCIKDGEDLLESINGLDGLADINQCRVASVLPAGRGKFLAEDTFILSGNSDTGGVCSAADFPIIFPDGRVMSCMGITEIPCGRHPLQLGNMNDSDLEEILGKGDHENYLHVMRCFGRDYITDLLTDTSTKAINLEQYKNYGSCSLCYAMANDPAIQKIVLDRVSSPALQKKTVLERMRLFGETTEDAFR